MIGRRYWQTFIVLANQPSPGNVIVENAGAPRDWEIRKGYGLAGASVVYTGENLSKFDVTLQFWTEIQLDDWHNRFRTIVAKPPKNIAPKALACQHPLLDDLEIDKVVVLDRTQLTPSPSGLWTVKVSLLQYKKPAPALARPNGAIPNAPGTVPRQEDLLDQKTQEARNAFNRAKEAAE